MSCTEARRAIETGRFRWQRRQQRMGGWKGAVAIPEIVIDARSGTRDLGGGGSKNSGGLGHSNIGTEMRFYILTKCLVRVWGRDKRDFGKRTESMFEFDDFLSFRPPFRIDGRLLDCSWTAAFTSWKPQGSPSFGKRFSDGMLLLQQNSSFSSASGGTALNVKHAGTGRTITRDALPSDTIDAVKAKIQNSIDLSIAAGGIRDSLVAKCCSASLVKVWKMVALQPTERLQYQLEYVPLSTRAIYFDQS
jgi:hypothetical protein